MATNDKERWYSERRPLAVALAAPAVRMVYVDAWACEGESGHTVYPVVALRSTVARVFAKKAARYPETGGTEKDLLDSGWWLDRQEETTSALIHTEEYGLIASDDDLISDVSNVAGRLCVCPWPADEDAARLAPVVEELAGEARKKDAASEARRVPAKAEA